MHFPIKICIFLSCFKYICAIECEDNINFHLATKTPYRFVANLNHSQITYNGCEAQKIWMITRHGTRNPSESLVNVMQDRLTELRDQILRSRNNLLNSDVELFRKWKARVDTSDEKKLTHEGQDEMVDLSERMQARFPNILSDIYSNTSYKFKFTHTQRAKASAINFAIGLFGRSTAKDVWFPAPSKKDPILRFYKLCKRWKDEVKKNPAALAEVIKLQKSASMKNVITKIEKITGLAGKITYEDVYNMYMACAFETAWYKKRKSPWCSMFDLDTIKIMEYSEDIKYYHIDGYAYNITYRQACPAFDNMMSFLEDKNKYPKAVLYFTHSGTLLKLLAHLGLYKDETPLRYNNMDENRKWRVSQIDAFGTNLAFVSFKCKDDTKLLLLHQERVVRLPSCPDQDLCSLSSVKSYFKDSLGDCRFNQICES